jgi:hypothetical protein
MSTIRAASIANLAGTGPVTLQGQWAAKSWINFNGTATVTTRGSANVSSLTDNGLGDYTVSFSSAFGAADYSAVSSAYENSARQTQGGQGAPTTSAYRFISYTTSFGFADAQYLFLSVHGDLA